MAINTEIDDFNPVYGIGEFRRRPSARMAAGTTDTGAREAAYLADFLTGARSTYQLNNFVIVNYHQ